MNFTFGIITAGSQEIVINHIISSIRRQKIPNYEIIIVGSCFLQGEDIINVPFDETIKQGWITKKKNIITNLAKYDNIVYLHDYFYFDDNWYQGQLKAGEDFYVRMDQIRNVDDSRYRDWVIWPHNDNHMDELMKTRECLISYDITHLSKYMYISGGYWISKKSFMLEYPLNEELGWGESEDGEWSNRIRDKYDFNMNTHSIVRLARFYKSPAFNVASEELNNKLRNIQ